MTEDELETTLIAFLRGQMSEEDSALYRSVFADTHDSETATVETQRARARRLIELVRANTKPEDAGVVIWHEGIVLESGKTYRMPSGGTVSVSDA